MWANRVIGALVLVLLVPVTVVGFVTTFVGGLIMVIPIVGLLFVLATTLFWLPFFGVLLGTAWLWHRTPWYVHPLIVLIGIPVAVVGNVYITLIPGGPEPGDQLGRHTKQTLCQQWPYAVADDEGRSAIAVYQAETGEGFLSAVIGMMDLVARRQSPWGRYVI